MDSSVFQSDVQIVANALDETSSEEVCRTPCCLVSLELFRLAPDGDASSSEDEDSDAFSSAQKQARQFRQFDRRHRMLDEFVPLFKHNILSILFQYTNLSDKK